MERKAYPSYVSDEEWALVALYLALMTDVNERSGDTRFGPWEPDAVRKELFDCSYIFSPI
jgi:hypothetical protein